MINMNGKYISEGHSVCSTWHLPRLCVYTCVEAQDPLWESSLVAPPLLTGWGFQSSSELYVKDQLLHGPPSLYWNYKQVARPPSTYVSSRIQTDPHACAASSLTTKPRPQKNNGGGKKKTQQTNQELWLLWQRMQTQFLAPTWQQLTTVSKVSPKRLDTQLWFHEYRYVGKHKITQAGHTNLKYTHLKTI